MRNKAVKVGRLVGAGYGVLNALKSINVLFGRSRHRYGLVFQLL